MRNCPVEDRASRVSLFQNIRKGRGTERPSYSIGAICYFVSGTTGAHFTTLLPSFPGLRMTEVMPPLSHVPSWRAQTLISFPAGNTKVSVDERPFQYD